MNTYRNLDEFYAERGMKPGVESDYGYYNWDDLDILGLRFHEAERHRIRVSHIHSTGDFYAVDVTPGRQHGRAAVLGQVPTGLTEREVHQLFGDWASGGQPGRPLSWFLNRLQEIGTNLAT